MLERVWDLSVRHNPAAPAPAFARTSERWRLDAGFSSANPADDLRGMGELGLACLVFFLETHPAEAAMMKRVRGGYPFVKAALAVARALAEVFRLVDEDSRVGKFPVTRTLYWQVLETETSFFELFALLFLLFDELFCEEAAVHTQLQDELTCSIAVVTKLVDAAKRKLLLALVKAPMCVDDLSGLCANALHALSHRHERLALLEQQRAAAASAAVAPVSLWKQHETHRKSMREVCKNWREDVAPRRRCRTYASSKSTGECLHRLEPRQPEISFSPPPAVAATSQESSKAVEQDDEEGEETKGEERHVDPSVSLSCCPEPEVEASLFQGLVLSKSAAVASPAALQESMLDARRHCAATVS